MALPEIGFFRLSHLVDDWQLDRKTVRQHTIGRGCPHVPVGHDVLFVTETFVQWLKDQEEGGPESV